jgi:hypothetical protein
LLLPSTWLACAAPPVPAAAPVPRVTHEAAQVTAPTEMPSAAPAPATEVEPAAEVEPATARLDPHLMEDAPPRCPPEMTLVLESVCVDRWEGSLVELQAGGVDKPWSPYVSLAGATRPLRAVSETGRVPQGYISGDEAEQACRLSGKRLCSAREWGAACRGPHRTTYPYGATRMKHMCNDDGRKSHPVAEVTKRLGLPPDRMWYEGMEHPLINQLDNTLRKSGEREQCTNETGAFDMVGNLHEWIDDPNGTFRGGFYMDTQINGEGCDYATTAHSKGYHDYSTGFRCCTDADRVE